MQRFDRLLGILLFLRSEQSVSASLLARHFAVSTRTIYRDLETLSSLGVPLYTERGRTGGIRLLPGYFLPPLMFTQEEALALLLGLLLQRSLHAVPFSIAIPLAEKKLLAALPDTWRSLLVKAEQLIGFEQLPQDIFHPEPDYQALPTNTIPGEQAGQDESSTISTFFRAILDGNLVGLQYWSPYHGETANMLAEPLGLFWDRDRWYLVGKPIGQEQTVRLLRADRVVQIKLRQQSSRGKDVFDVRKLLGRTWLQPAMEQWRQRVPVKIRLSCSQAKRLRQDWYYRHAHFEQIAGDQVLMTFGETNSMLVLELLRWLGPGAELIEPKAWRERMREELRQMLAYYTPE